MRKSKNTSRGKYDRRGTINPVPGQHDGLDFRYKLMSANEMQNELMVIEGKPPGEYVAGVAAIVAKKLTAWGEVDDDGNPIPITAENVLAIKPNELFVRFKNIVFGISPTDLPPDATTQDVSEYMLVMDGVKQGVAPGDTLVTDQRKNSTAG